ncbi:MAG TPA: hypothetical protein VMF52_19445 [Steroidobacteraceae bacterium]|nr:hypothetical protein [Steroidobacteraceae bacterium]
MKVIVDASIVTREAGGFGNVSGSIELSAEPRIGDTISFSIEKAGVEMPPGFNGLVRVRNRVLTAGGDPHGPLIELHDIEVQTIEDAQALIAYLEQAFGLFANVYDESDDQDRR